jgi:hypothetical protein
MTKLLIVLAAGSAVALVSVAAPTTADARCRGCGVAAGVIGGIAAGAAIASAASRPDYYGPDYYAYDSAYSAYGYAPGYAYEGPYYGYYGRRWYGGATSDYSNNDRDLVGTR